MAALTEHTPSEQTGLQQTLRLTIVFAATAAILKFQGRTFWCKCGSWLPWSWDIWSTHNSQHLLDPYFFTHVLHGVILYGVLFAIFKHTPRGTRLLWAVLLEAGWEILENSSVIINRYREATISLDYFGDSIANSLFDIVACVIGFAVAARLRVWQSVVLVVATELLLLMAIRDCLALNVLMLLFPIDAVKDWQSGA